MATLKRDIGMWFTEKKRFWMRKSKGRRRSFPSTQSSTAPIHCLPLLRSSPEKSPDRKMRRVTLEIMSDVVRYGTMETNKTTGIELPAETPVKIFCQLGKHITFLDDVRQRYRKYPEKLNAIPLVQDVNVLPKKLVRVERMKWKPVPIFYTSKSDLITWLSISEHTDVGYLKSNMLLKNNIHYPKLSDSSEWGRYFFKADCAEEKQNNLTVSELQTKLERSKSKENVKLCEKIQDDIEFNIFDERPCFIEDLDRMLETSQHMNSKYFPYGPLGKKKEKYHKKGAEEQIKNSPQQMKTKKKKMSRKLSETAILGRRDEKSSFWKKHHRRHSQPSDNIQTEFLKELKSKLSKYGDNNDISPGEKRRGKLLWNIHI